MFDQEIYQVESSLLDEEILITQKKFKLYQQELIFPIFVFLNLIMVFIMFILIPLSEFNVAYIKEYILEVYNIRYKKQKY